MFLHVCRDSGKLIQLLIPAHQFHADLHLTVFGHQKIHQQVELAQDLQFIATVPAGICLVHIFDEAHHFLVLKSGTMGEVDETFLRIVIFERGQRYLKHNGPVGLWGLNGMNLIGIDQHEFSGLKRVFLLIQEES